MILLELFFATLSNSNAVERNQFDKFMYDVKLYSEIYEIFSKSEEKDCINLFFRNETRRNLIWIKNKYYKENLSILSQIDQNGPSKGINRL